ncbi:MAG: sugar ABC transporter permease [Bdellovibrionales bacterium CG10_big_fil_rev_8_21_14_0_10_45_34]|nr:MAG: sugar ABC transporter permease [Bdellovibrionales bacterium CG10_big_fil_rev_8_21_14_0_10_45_34]
MQALIELIASSWRLSLPLLLASLGGLWSEKSGVANIALEGKLLTSAFAAAAVTALTHNPWLGLLAGLLAGALIAGLFAFTCIFGRGDHIVVGTGINFLAIGFLPVMTRTLFGVTGSTPRLEISERLDSTILFSVVAVSLFVFTHWFLFQTKWGLYLRAAGENPTALSSTGVLPTKVRFFSVVAGGLICALGGVYLSISEGAGYVNQMSAGRGFLALAALILGRWKPVTTFAACAAFGILDALQIQLQGMNVEVLPSQFLTAMPFVVTLAAMAFFKARTGAPAAINQ